MDGRSQARAVDWLQSLIRADAPRGKAALASSQALFAALGNPQELRPAIHIVGTAGKGSAAIAITAGLVAAGERVATHVSPHVYDIRERFTIDGALPTWDLVVSAIDRVAAAAAQMEEPPTFFAATTATAIELGRAGGVDRYVIEAGIGGRVDATNVLSRADVLTVITAIGLDHTDVLGSTVAAIAAEKAAVLRGRTDLVLGSQPSPEAEDIIRAVAAEAGVAIHAHSAAGDWHAEASMVARAVLSILGHDAVIGRVSPPGRFERQTCLNRTVVFDGAHNPMKLAALSDGMAEPAALVVAAVGAGKDLAGCAAQLVGMASTVVATTFGPDADEPGPRSWPADDLADALRAAGADRVIQAEPDAIAAAVQSESEPGDLVVVTGSFLHLADVRQRLSTSHM